MSEEIKKLFPKDMKYIDALPIANYIEQLQQENQQLKDKLKGVQEERDYLFNKQSIENKHLIKENQQLQEVVKEAKEYANQKIKFNDDQIKEYKTCITTNINGKFPKEVKENMEYSMTILMCINYKLKNIVQILDKVKENK